MWLMQHGRAIRSVLLTTRFTQTALPRWWWLAGNTESASTQRGTLNQERSCSLTTGKGSSQSQAHHSCHDDCLFFTLADMGQPNSSSMLVLNELGTTLVANSSVTNWLGHASELLSYYCFILLIAHYYDTIYYTGHCSFTLGRGIYIIICMIL